MALAAGMAFLVILDAVFHWAQQPNPLAGSSWHWGSCLSRGCTRLLSSFVKAFHWQNTGEVPALYEFFQSSLKTF